VMSGNRLKGTPVRRRCAQEVPRRRCQRLQRGKVACAKSARDLGAALAPGERSLGFCGLAPVTPLRERPSLDALCASVMDSDSGWHPLAKLAEHRYTSRRGVTVRPHAELSPGL
jgi:hypothetical protein